MPQFNYQQDIAPYKGNHFGSSLRPSERQMMSNRYGAEEDKALDRTLKIAMAMESMRHSDLRYETGVFALQQAKEKAARERESNARMKPFMDDLNAAINDPEKSPYERDEAVSKVAMQYPNLLAVNPAAGKIFAGAAGATSTQIRGLEYQTRQTNREFTQASGYSDPELQEEALGGGKFGERGRRELQDLKYKTEQEKERIKAKTRDEKIENATLQRSFIKGIYESAAKLEHDVTPEDALREWRDDPANEGNKDVPQLGSKFSPAKLVLLKNMAIDIGLPEKDLSLPADLLHAKVINRAATIKRDLSKNLGFSVDNTRPKTKAGSGFTQ
jgi:hypothetical protein